MRSDGQTRNRLISISLGTLLALLPAYGCKGEQELACSWAPGRMAVDGKMADWEEVPTTYLEDEGVVLGACNDDNYLYFMFRVRDEKYARTIHRSGLTLWLDGKGKKGKEFTLTYRGGPKLQPLFRQNDKDPEGLPGRPGMNDSLMADRLTCAIKDRIVEMEIPIDGSEGPEVASSLDNGFYVYEFRVPLEEGKVRYYGLGAIDGSRITIGANWGKMDAAGRGPRPGGGMGGPGGGMGGGPPGGGMGGGPPGGGMGGGPPGGMGGNRPEMPEEQEIWLKTTLATAPAGSETK